MVHHFFYVPSQTWIWDYFETHQERVFLYSIQDNKQIHCACNCS